MYKRERGLEWAAHRGEGLVVEPLDVARSLEILEAFGRFVSDFVGEASIAAMRRRRVRKEETREAKLGNGKGMQIHREH